MNRTLILSSNSPRRQELLRALGYTFQIKIKPTEEDFPDEMPCEKVAEFLARKKAEVFLKEEISESVLITADTVVCLDNQILNKPVDAKNAAVMLQNLSGKKHEVITGVCIRSADKKVSFSETTGVYFKLLSEEEIVYYVSNFRPFDKAGAYGIQEWIGMIGVEKIEGSYYNVMGLPLHRLYAELQKF